MDPSKCPHFVAPNAIVAMGAFRTEDDELFPWTGRPLGLIDLRFVSATRRPHLVGIAGAADAGKTTLLCLLFLAIYRGRRIGPHTFSGSFTLQGWENIARHLQLNAVPNANSIRRGSKLQLGDQEFDVTGYATVSIAH